MEALQELLPKFGLECPHFTEFKPYHASKILESARGTDKYEAVNLMVLRSMAKAKYSPEPLGHFGLVRSSAAEIKAVTIERECEDCYKAEYMKAHIGESFEARISSVTEFGFYAELPNTIEGLIHIRTLPEGEYAYSEPVSLTEIRSGVTYSLGQTIRIVCAAVNVSDGMIDFVLDTADKQE